jgi:hypothetical protein
VAQCRKSLSHGNEKGPVVSGLETAIRNALEKTDRSSAEVRARVYQSSRQALEAGLRKQGIDDPNIVAQQRQRLETLIHQIEQEERNRLLDVVAEHMRREPAAAQVPPQARSVRPAPLTAEPLDEDDDAISVEPETRGAPSRAPDVGDFRAERSSASAQGTAHSAAGDAASLAFKPERAVRGRKRRRGLFARLFIMFTLLAFVGLAGWWVYSSGLLLTPAQRDTSVPNPPAEVQSEDFTGNEPEPSLQAGRGFSDDWVEIYNADRGNAGIRSGSQASIENIATPAGKAIRVTSKSAGDDGSINIEVPAEVLKDMVGKSSTISVTLQSSSDRQTQVSISCDFSSLGDCARHRFTATPERADMLINASFDRTLAPNSAGRIAINSDIDGDGRPINLYSVRILPGQ